MKISHIMPLAYQLRYGSESEFDLVEACACSDSNYLSYHQGRRDMGIELVLDNSVKILGHPMEAEELAKVVEALQPTVLVLPDVIADGPKTWELVEEFATHYEGLTHLGVEFMPVIQGGDQEEWIRCYKIYMEMGFKQIGIPHLITCYIPGPQGLSEFDDYSEHRDICIAFNRTRLLKLIEELPEFSADTVKHHLLGLQHWQELTYFYQFPWVSRFDTSYAFQCAQKGLRVLWVGNKDWPPLDFNVGYKPLLWLRSNMQQIDQLIHLR